MSFHATGEGFHVENHVLKGRLRNTGGATVDAHINLDDFLGNEDGEFGCSPRRESSFYSFNSITGSGCRQVPLGRKLYVHAMLFSLRLVQGLLTCLTAFSKTAENVHFAIEGGASVPVLRARLRKLDGSYVDSAVNLAERIKNVDGRFVYGKSTPYLPWQGGDELS